MNATFSRALAPQSPPPSTPSAGNNKTTADKTPTTVYLFLTGRHFHPTQTHVIAAGVKADSLEAASEGKKDSSGADAVESVGPQHAGQRARHDDTPVPPAAVQPRPVRPWPT